MKKLVSLALVMVMLCVSFTAFASELQTAEITVDPAQGSTMVFEDLGFELTIPEALAQTDVPESLAETDIFDCYALADGSAFLMLGGTEMADENSLNNLLASLQADSAYSDIGVLTINGISWLAYAKVEDNLLMFSTDVGTTLFTVYSSPYNDETFRSTVLSILGSLTVSE